MSNKNNTPVSLEKLIKSKIDEEDEIIREKRLEAQRQQI